MSAWQRVGPSVHGVRRDVGWRDAGPVGATVYFGAMDVLLLLLAGVGLAAACSAYFRLRPRNGVLMFVNFIVGWLVGELAMQVMVLQMLGCALLVWAGALEGSPGQAGFGLACVAWGLLIASHLRALGVRDHVAAFAARHDLQARTDDIGPFHRFWRPFNMTVPGVRVVRDIPYGEPLPGDRGGRNLLNVVMPEAHGERRPVLLQVHGGAWVLGDKNEQAWPLMTHVAANGWVCFAINYRLSPQATFPDHIVDVKRAIAWIRAHAAEYGGDPDFICVTGGSAGGHLAALAALTPNMARLQPGFEDVDTRLAAAVPFYGVYDWLDRNGLRSNHSMEPFLVKRVLKCSPAENRELWELASPISHLRADAPPLLAIQGTHDSLVFAEETAAFVEALAAHSQQPALHLEVAGAQHAFDTFHSVRSACAVRVAAAFLARAHAAHLAGQAAAA